MYDRLEDPEPQPELPEHGTVTPPPAGPRGRGWKLEVIGKEPLQEIIDEAVARTLGRRLKRYDQRVVERVQRELRVEFLSLLKENSLRTRATSRRGFLEELERSRDELLRARNEARRQLADLTKRLEFLAGIEAMDERIRARTLKDFEAVHTPRLRGRIRELVERREAGELSSAELQEQLVLLVTDSIVADRSRTHRERSARHARLVTVYQRRLSKARRALRESEEHLRELARRRAERAGLASAYRSVQGLSPDEENLRMKRELLERIYRANVLLQERTG